MRTGLCPVLEDKRTVNVIDKGGICVLTLCPPKCHGHLHVHHKDHGRDDDSSQDGFRNVEEGLREQAERQQDQRSGDNSTQRCPHTARIIHGSAREGASGGHGRHKRAKDVAQTQGDHFLIRIDRLSFAWQGQRNGWEMVDGVACTLNYMSLTKSFGYGNTLQNSNDGNGEETRSQRGQHLVESYCGPVDLRFERWQPERRQSGRHLTSYGERNLSTRLLEHVGQDSAPNHDQCVPGQ